MYIYIYTYMDPLNDRPGSVDSTDLPISFCSKRPSYGGPLAALGALRCLSGFTHGLSPLNHWIYTTRRKTMGKPWENHGKMVV